ncbi:MAG: hypothetical protein H6Q73_4304 [Firmicutes bacterium]|nr:hypothetical protein [Bacillota bacterium]
MLLEINEKNLKEIRNSGFKEYAQIYTRIYGRFLEQVKSHGLEFAACRPDNGQAGKMSLQGKNMYFRNNDHSIHNNWLSPACKACNTGENSATFYLSLACHRQCYYCFNPNQEDYEEHTLQRRDSIRELKQIKQTGGKLSYIALTGGEPLLHKQETIRFFQEAKRLFPQAHTRLYTSGDLLDKDVLAELARVRLDEIRFSIKLEDSPAVRAAVMERIGWAKDSSPSVVVEMPIIPGTLPEMKALLQELDAIGIAGINLLEFCFPYHNQQEFQRRMFKLKNPPYKVLYDYWYAGGLPVDQSEEECLALLTFAAEQNLTLGVHYCSLANKFSGQIFQQNQLAEKSGLIYLSPKDYFIKTAKVFGKDVQAAMKVFRKQHMTDYELNEDYQYLEFPVSKIFLLKDMTVEVGISTSIMENRCGEIYRRELKIERVFSQDFQIDMV